MNGVRINQKSFWLISADLTENRFFSGRISLGAGSQIFLSRFQEDGLRQVLQEMEALFEQNQTDV